MIMKPSPYVLLLPALTLLVGGCSSGGGDPAADPPAVKSAETTSYPPPPPPPPPAAHKPAGDRPSGATNDQQTPAAQPVVAPSAAVAPQPPVVPRSTATSPQAPSPQVPAGGAVVRLSAGVALPQTTPAGTMMSFSVDYEFTGGQPNATARYVWVIEPATGPPARFAVRLTNKDTLQAFVPKWRPRDGPFQAHIEEPDGNRLSASAPLR